MNIYEHIKLEETLDQWDFKHDKIFEMVEHNMIWIERGTWRKFEGVKERR